MKVFVRVEGLDNLQYDAAQPYALVNNEAAGRNPKLFPIRKQELAASLELPVRKAIGIARTRGKATLTFIRGVRG